MLYPMAMMVLLTFIVGMLAVKVRFASVRNGDVNARFYRLMQGQDVPDIVIKTTRSFNNMFEVPTLFYCAGTLYLALGVESMFAVVLAWLFVGLRYLHAYIHLSYNHIVHRLLSFWAAFLSVLVLWGNLLIKMA